MSLIRRTALAVAATTTVACWLVKRRSAPTPVTAASYGDVALPSTEELVDAVTRLIAHPTIAGEADSFRAMQAELAQLFPNIWRQLEIETIGDDQTGLLIRWPGSDTELAASPVVLMAHQDVVPVEGQDWRSDPFAAEVRDGKLYGRGASDDKSAFTVTLAAIEALLASGFTPRRDLYLLLGDCEEVGGDTATQAAALLACRGITPWLVFDEGGAVVEPGALPALDVEAAMIGVAEKGQLEIQLTTADSGGHASTPQRNSAPVRLARAILAIEQQPFPAKLNQAVVTMLQTVGDIAPRRLRSAIASPLPVVFRNADLLARPLTRVLANLGPETAAMVRTTVAVTQLQGSPANNVLANEVSAGLNIRLAIGEKAADAVAYLRRVIDDESIQLNVIRAQNPSPVSPAEGAQWDALRRALATAYPEAVAVSYVQNGATDSTVFGRYCRHIYRFAPLRLDAADRAAVHAANESISVDTLRPGVEFIAALVADTCG